MGTSAPSHRRGTSQNEGSHSHACHGMEFEAIAVKVEEYHTGFVYYEQAIYSRSVGGERGIATPWLLNSNVSSEIESMPELVLFMNHALIPPPIPPFFVKEITMDSFPTLFILAQYASKPLHLFPFQSPSSTIFTPELPRNPNESKGKQGRKSGLWPTRTFARPHSRVRFCVCDPFFFAPLSPYLLECAPSRLTASILNLFLVAITVSKLYLCKSFQIYNPHTSILPLPA